MLKSLITLFLCFFITDVAYCNTADTSIIYYKTDARGTQRKVHSLDSADFFKIILPPDPGESLYNVKEFYANGHPKLIGKSDAYLTKPADGVVILQGPCISFYPDGKRKYIANFYNGYLDGVCTEYYPTGEVYYHMKYNYRAKPYYIDCYDKNGNLIAKDGNGSWVDYAFDSPDYFVKGNIKNGNPEGDWKGQISKPEAIKFTYTFKKGNFVAGHGYGTDGKVYTFTHTSEAPGYKDGPLVFSGYIQRNIVLPRDSAGKKLKDVIWVTFMVERDGRLDDFKVLGNPNLALAEAAIDVLKKSPPWKPRRFFGVPVPSKITFPINEDDYGGMNRGGYAIHKIEYGETIPEFDIMPGGDK